MEDFIETMLQELEAKEQQLQLSQIDTILMEISKLQTEIEHNFKQAEEEKKLIDEWAISRNAKIQERADWLTKKLEAWMAEHPDTKTVDLPHGQLLRRKQIDKFEVTDLELFMTNKNLSQLTNLQPEIIVPSKEKIKAFYKMTTKLPAGVELISGVEKFSIKIKQNGGTNGKTQAGTGASETYKDNFVV